MVRLVRQHNHSGYISILEAATSGLTAPNQSYASQEVVRVLIQAHTTPIPPPHILIYLPTSISLMRMSQERLVIMQQTPLPWVDLR